MRRGSGSVGWLVPKTPVVPGSNLAISNFYKEHKFPFNYKRQKHNEKGGKSSPFFNMTIQRLQYKMFNIVSVKIEVKFAALYFSLENFRNKLIHACANNAIIKHNAGANQVFR